MKVEYRATFASGENVHVTVDKSSVNAGFFKALGLIRRNHGRKELTMLAYWQVEAEISERRRTR
jgi:hypothetical protein